MAEKRAADAEAEESSAPKRARPEGHEAAAPGKVVVDESVRPPAVGLARPWKRKVKVALLVAYSGTGYQGLQINPGAKTIEQDLEEALYQAGCIAEANRGQLTKVNWTRGSRTDKGVHALGNVISLRALFFKEETEEDVRRRVNNLLPEQIRVLGILPVINSFNAKHACSSRAYDYVFPTYALQRAEEYKNSIPAGWDPTKDYMPRNYRATLAQREEFQRILSTFVGTKNYHNYTDDKEFTDPSANRFIMSFNVVEVFPHRDVEFMRVQVQGASFMIYQIRRMIGMAIAVMRGDASVADFERSFFRDRVHVPTAPALGLLLNRMHFVTYDKRMERLKASQGNAKMSMTPFIESLRAAAEEFGHKYVYSEICRQEVEGEHFIHWLRIVDGWENHWGRPRASRGGEEPDMVGGQREEGGDDEERNKKGARRDKNVRRKPRIGDLPWGPRPAAAAAVAVAAESGEEKAAGTDEEEQEEEQEDGEQEQEDGEGGGGDGVDGFHAGKEAAADAVGAAGTGCEAAKESRAE